MLIPKKKPVVIEWRYLSLRLRGIVILLFVASLLWPPSVTAQNRIAETTKAKESPSTVLLQDRLIALTQLIHYRFRGDESLLKQRRSEVESVLSDWNSIDGPSPKDSQQMEAWLEVAIRSSMPGRNGKLPRPPHFGHAIQHPMAPIANSTIDPSTSKPRPVRQSREVIDPMAEVPIAEVVKPTLCKPRDPQRSQWSRHPSAAPLKWSDPFTDEPQSNANPFRQDNDRYETRRPLLDGGGISVDLAELSAEVRGYNAALRTLSQRLTQQEEVSTAMLTAIAEELERLETERRFLDLYRAGLSEVEQRSLPSSPSAELVYEIVRRKTAKRLRTTPSSQNQERRTLEGLAARLAHL